MSDAPSFSLRATGLAALAILGTIACGPAVPPPHATARRPAKAVTPAPTAPLDSKSPMFGAVAIDDLDSAEGSHFFARSKDGALLVFEHEGKLLSRATAVDGTPRAKQPTEVGPAPVAPAELVIGKLVSAGDGYVLLWAERDTGRTKVLALAMDASGAPRGKPATMGEGADEVWSLDVLPREGGALAVWETRSATGQRADIHGVPLSPAGAPSGPAVMLITGALAWHPAASGSAIAAVMPLGGDDEAEPGTVATGRVTLVPLDAAGKPKLPVEISASGTAQPDVTTAEIGGRVVLAWTDMRDIDAAVWTAAVDRAGAIVAPAKRATPPTGEQAIVAAVGGTALGGAVPKGLLAWEDVIGVSSEVHHIHLGVLGPDGSLGKERATLVFQADGAPTDLTADESGFGVITLASTWEGEEPKEKALPVPMFVRFGPDLTVRSAEVVRTGAFADDGVPYYVHGLACRSGACSALAVSAESPAHVALVDLPSRASGWASPARRDPDDTPPRAASLSALYNGQQIARVTAADVPGGGGLAAWVTYSPDGDPSVGSKRSGSAEVAVLPVTADGRAGAPAPISISKKAISVGGVAIAPATGDKKEIAIAWVARERGESQVYVTKVDETGKRLGQKKLTVAPRIAKGAVTSEASDVAIAWAGPDNGEGWIVSWVDTRDGNAEIYAAKVDRSLNKIGPDRRITDAVGDAADVRLLSRGKETFVAWSDARGGKTEERLGDIYVTRLETRTLNKLGPETRVASTPGHSRSPELIPGPSGSVWASWVDEPTDAEVGGSVRFAVLDDKGAATVTTKLAGDAEHQVVSAAIACGDKTCRVVLGRAGGGAMRVEALDLSPSAQPSAPKTLLTLPGVGAADVTPVFSDRAGTTLFFAADASTGLGRVRRLAIDW